MMEFAQDLLWLADRLLSTDAPNSTQSNLRRAVSTAYYALFHLLIDEAVSHWAVARHRSKLARTFDHGAMRKICEDQIKNFRSVGSPAALALLAEVAQTFVELQSARHTADYDNSYIWTKADAQEWIDRTAKAFTSWRAIRAQDESQDFLLSLFLPKLTR